MYQTKTEREISFLRKLQDAYHGRIDYLDAMFRTYREDFVRPLREALKSSSSLRIRENAGI